MARPGGYLIPIASLFLFGLKCAYLMEAQPEPIRIDFTVFGYRQWEGIQFLNPEGKPEEMKFLNSGRSPRYRYRGPNPIVFFRDLPAPSGTDREAIDRHIVGRVEVPPGMETPLFIFFPLPKSDARLKEAYRIYLFDDGLENFPIGQVVFFNASGSGMNGYVGQRKVSLNFGASESVSLAGAAQAVFYVPFNGRYYQTFNGAIRCSSRERVLLFFFPPFVRGSSEVQYRVLRDSFEETSPEASPSTLPTPP